MTREERIAIEFEERNAPIGIKLLRGPRRSFDYTIRELERCCRDNRYPNTFGECSYQMVCTHLFDAQVTSRKEKI